MNDRLAAYLHVLFAPATLFSLHVPALLDSFIPGDRERKKKREPRIHARSTHALFNIWNDDEFLAG